MSQGSVNPEAPVGTTEALQTIVKDAAEEVAKMKQELTDTTIALEELHSAAEQESKTREAEVGALKAQIENLTQELAKVTAEKSELASKLEKIEEDKLLNDRLSVLKEKNLLREADDAQLKQAAKVIRMTEEEFEDYVGDLSDILNRATTKSIKEIEEKVAEEKNESEAAETVAKAISEKSASDPEVIERISRILKNLDLMSSPPSSLSNDSEEEETETAEDESASAFLQKESASISAPTAQLLEQGFAAIMKKGE